MSKMWTVAELAVEVGLSGSRVRELAAAGRFPGAHKVGGSGRRGVWLIPEEAVEVWQATDRDRRYKDKVPDDDG